MYLVFIASRVKSLFIDYQDRHVVHTESVKNTFDRTSPLDLGLRVIIQIPTVSSICRFRLRVRL